MAAGQSAGPSRPDSSVTATTSWSATPTRRSSRRSMPTGCASKGRSSSSPPALTRSARARCPTGSTSRSWWPASSTTRPLPRRSSPAAPGEAFVVSLQNGLPSPALAAAAGSGRVVQACVNFGADVLAPGVVMRGNRGTFKIGEIDGTPSARIDALAADIADAEATTEVMGFVWGKEAYGATLFATAVSDLAIHEVFDNPAYRPLLLAVATEVLGQAPVRPLPIDGFDPDDLTGSLPRLADFNRRSAKSHSGIYRDLAIRHPQDGNRGDPPTASGFLISQIAELIAAIEAERRTCCQENLDLLAAYERLDRLGRPLNAVVAVAGAPRRAAAGPLSGRPSWSRTSSRSPGCRPGAAARHRLRARDRGRGAGRRPRAVGAEVFATAQCLEFAAGFANPRVGTPATRAIRPGPRAAHRAGRPLWSPQASANWRWAPTPRLDRIPAAYRGVVGLKPTHGPLTTTGCSAVAEPGPRGDADRDGRRQHRPAGTVSPAPAGADRLLSAFRSSACCRPTCRPVRDAGGARGDPHRARPARRRWLAAGRGQAPVAGGDRALGGGADRHRRPRGGRVARGPGHEPGRRGTRALLAFGAWSRRSSTRAPRCPPSCRRRSRRRWPASMHSPGRRSAMRAEQDPLFGVGDDNAEGRFTGPYNLTGHPAVSIPLPASGLPVGLQLAGRRDGDLALLDLAAAAQRLLRGRHRRAASRLERRDRLGGAARSSPSGRTAALEPA